jgi:transcriptional regulator with XRE-family HTH domain
MANYIAQKIDSIKSVADMKSRDLAILLDTSPQTISRWTHGQVEPQPTHLKRLLELEWLMIQISDLYAPQQARLWLFTRHKLLNGETPAERVSQGKIDEVIALISQLKDSAFV